MILLRIPVSEVKPRGRMIAGVAACLALLAGPIAAQAVRGRIVDSKTRLALPGALVELRDTSGRSLQVQITPSSGAFVIIAPGAGRFLLRVAAIGYTPRPPTPIEVSPVIQVLPDIPMTPVSVRLPDLVVVARQRFCGNTGFSDAVFGQLLEGSLIALQVIEATIRSKQVGFQVAIVTSRTLYGPFNNFITADTAIRVLTTWPVQSVPADTLRAFGFGRQLKPGNEGSREYYGPDPQVLFSDWFLAGHCFTLAKVKKGSDTLHVRFAPIRKGKQIDLRGELLLDGKDLSLHAMTFNHINLPAWMPEEAAGGEMQFSRMANGLWVTRNWAIWAPIAGFAWGGDGGVSIAGLAEVRGYVTRIFMDGAGPHR